jgi:hypothetical protein
MKLEAVDRKTSVLHGGERTGCRLRQWEEIIRDACHLIAVAHPNLRILRDIGQQGIVSDNATICATVLPRRGALHLPAHCFAGQLHSVADPQYGYSQAENLGIALWCPGLVDASRPSGKDYTLRLKLADPIGGNVVADYLTIDLLLADAPGDELRVLGPKIEHQHSLLGDSLHVRDL